MRFKDMIQLGIGKDRPTLKPKPYADDTVRVGHHVRCRWEGHKDVIGTVAADLDDRWLIEVRKSDGHGNHWTVQERFKKGYCERIRTSEMSKIARGKGRATEDKIYGDGDI